MKKTFSGALLLFASGLIAGSIIFTSMPARSQPQQVWQPLGEQIVQVLDEAQARYKAGDAKEARRAVIKAYFALFESRKMEAAMRTTIGVKHTYEVEQRFGDLRKAIKNGASVDKVDAIAKSLRTSIRQDAKILDKAGVPAEVFKVDP